MACIGDLTARLAGRQLAVFLDYDGTLTPIVDHPEDALIGSSMRDAVTDLARLCPVVIVSGRDRRVVQQLMGVDNLIVAGSHGFDIWSPGTGGVVRDEAARHEELVRGVEAQLREELAGISGAHIEPKRASVAVHWRLVPDNERTRVRGVVYNLLATHPGALKITPGRMVYEIQPAIDWDKGRAVLHLLSALDLDGPAVPVYLGDDLTDEHAFEALAGRGAGILVGAADDPELAGRMTSAQYGLAGVADVEGFLRALRHCVVGNGVDGRR